MNEPPKPLDWLKDVGVTIHEVLRYGFGGLLAILVAAIVSPDEIKKLADSLGLILTVVVAIGLGGAIYAVHRPISEPFFMLHEWIHKLSGKRFVGHTCRIQWLVQKWKVHPRLAFDAFRIIRDDKDVFNPERQKRFYLQHSELHSVYVATWVLFGGAIATWLGLGNQPLLPGWGMFTFGLFALAAGTYGNILLCRQECKVCLLIPEEKIRPLLERAEFIESTPQTGDWIAARSDNIESPAILYPATGPFSGSPQVQSRAWLNNLLNDGRVELLSDGQAVGPKYEAYRVK